jgi:hypothetical protein
MVTALGVIAAVVGLLSEGVTHQPALDWLVSGAVMGTGLLWILRWMMRPLR